MDFSILENLTSPKELKSMSDDKLKILSDELREALILNVSNTGGHLASNLGVVELTIAIHKVFSSPEDQIIFDVGHQCYVHKMLTGRYKSFSTLRQKNGLSGFPNPEESEHDIFKTGHSSTSISSALGLACAKSLSGDNESSVVAVIGDGSMTGGLAYEGLNNAGNSGKNLIVILNDNKMSISKNVGAISKTLTRLRSKTGYFHFKDAFGNFLVKIPCIGKPLYRRLNRLKSAIKSYFYSSNIFESMGFKYIGPIDGHNIELLVRVLIRAKSLKRPVLVHVKTKKGKGYTFAENKPREFHGISKFDIETGNTNQYNQLSFTDVFGKTLTALASENDKICAITAAMGASCGLSGFKAQFPKRYFDVGIAEQHAVTFAGGLAKNGFLPVFAVYSTFLQRSYDQIIHDISLQNIKMIFAVDRAGIVGDDGETHQGLFDIPMLLPIPNIAIFSPSTGTELQVMLKRCVYDETDTCVLRYPKGNCIEYTDYPFKNPFGNYEIVDKGADCAIISYGHEIIEVLSATTNLNIDIIKLNIINIFGEGFLEKLTKYKSIILAEECYKTGGIGEFLEHKLNSKGFSGKFYNVSIENQFIKHAPPESVRKDFSLDGQSLRHLIISVIDN